MCPIWLPLFLIIIFLNDQGLGTGLDPGMALTTFPTSILIMSQVCYPINWTFAPSIKIFIKFKACKIYVLPYFKVHQSEQRVVEGIINQ